MVQAKLFDRELVVNAGGVLIASRSEAGAVQPLLRVQFKVVRSLKPEPNTADLTIFNLNAENRAALTEEGLQVVIEAGYAENISQIFAGSLQFGSNVKQGVDWLTTIQLADGGTKYKSARINTSLRGPANIGDVLKTVAESMGLNLGNLQEKISAGSLRSSLQELTNGKVLSGKAEQIMTKVTRSMGYSWSIQDDQIQILGSGETVDERAVLLAPGTGLIGSPEPGEGGIVKVKSLLQPEIAPGRKLQIQSREVDAFYRTDKVIFTGDTWGGDWYSDAEATPL